MAITAELNNLQPSLDVPEPNQREVIEVAETSQKNIESTSEGLEKLESDRHKRTKSFWKKALDLIRISKNTEGTFLPCDHRFNWDGTGSVNRHVDLDAHYEGLRSRLTAPCPNATSTAANPATRSSIDPPSTLPLQHSDP
ncbi:hypothetical protein SprV_0401534800 [Sparganum proliferum]